MTEHRQLNICHYLKNKVRTTEKFHPSAYKVMIHLFYAKINTKIERIRLYTNLIYCAKLLLLRRGGYYPPASNGRKYGIDKKFVKCRNVVVIL